MTIRTPWPASHAPVTQPRKKRIEIQDAFLFGGLKDGRLLTFSLTSGKEITGRIKRFDRFTVLVESDSVDRLVYKHAIVGIAEVRGSGSRS